MTPIDADRQAASRAKRTRPGARWAAIALTLLGLTLAFTIGTITAASAPANASSPAFVTAERREPPDVRTLTLPEARNRILSEWYADFKPTIEVDPKVPDQMPLDKALVVDQAVVRYLEDSDEGTPAAVIRLTPGSIVPDLTGRTRDEAESLLTPLGFYLKPSGEGLVTSQDPAAGSLEVVGTTVVARLEPPPTVGPTVPSVLGLTEAAATAELERVKLRLVVGSETGEGERLVSQQDPAPGVPVGASESVTVTLVGRDVLTVTVPDVSGLEVGAVQRVLAAADLPLAIDPTGDPAGPGALAFRQDPEPGIRVAPGTSVSVAFATVVDDASPAAWWVWPTGAAVLAVLLLALWSLHLFRRRPPSPRPPDREPTHPPTPSPDVAVRPRADLEPAVTVSSPDPSADFAIRVVPGADVGTLTLFEELP